MLITADADGSNGHRTRAWKTELAALAAETGLHITVCHLPPGTSKWNKIEHRLFSHITMNWRGRPLSSHDVIVASIAATTRTGLTVHAELDTGTYPTGVEVNDEQIAALPMTRHRFHSDWNYTLHPHPMPAPSPGQQQPVNQVDRTILSNPELTGMPREQLHELTTKLADSQAAQRERNRTSRRGGPRRRAPGAGRHHKLTDTDRILATVLHQRRLCTQAVLGELFGVDRTVITTAIQDTAPLLEQHGYTITPSTARLPTPADLITFLSHDTRTHPKTKTTS